MSINKKIIFAALMASAISTGNMLFASNQLGYTGNLNGTLGVKKLKTSDWDPNEQQLLYGVQADFRRPEWPISIALDAFGSFNTHKRGGAHVMGSTEEFSTGVRKVWEEFGSIEPFLGFGPSIVRAHAESSTSSNGGHIVVEDTGIALGVWIGGGVMFRVTPTFNLGAGLRFSDSSVKLFTEHVEAGGVDYMLLAGVHF